MLTFQAMGFHGSRYGVDAVAEHVVRLDVT
jgi:hypothetical protein